MDGFAVDGLTGARICCAAERIAGETGVKVSCAGERGETGVRISCAGERVAGLIGRGDGR